MNPKPLILIDTGIIGGPGRGIIQLAKFLRSKNIRCLICNFRYRLPKSREFAEELQRQGLDVATVSQRLPVDPTPILQFFRLAKKGRYNVVQSHGYKSHFVALIVARITGLPWVAFAHGWTQEDRKVSLYHSLDRWMLRFADTVVTVSPPLYALFREIRGNNRQTKLIFNAVDPSGLSSEVGGEAIRRRFLTGDKNILVGCFGRLSFEKGQDILLHASTIVLGTYPNATFLFLGDGPAQESLVQLAHRLGLGDSVIFQPHASAMRDYYEAIDLLVLPSRSEGLPNVILEAISFGVRVVAADVGAVRDVITDRNNGWLVPSGDHKALAAAIIEGFSDMTRQDAGAEVKQGVLDEKFKPDYRSQQIVELYEDVLREKLGKGDISELGDDYRA